MARHFLRSIVIAIIRWEAKLVLRKYRPKIVGITGSVGKTGTKEAVAAVLRSRYQVRQSAKSFNGELGVPLTILNLPNAWWSLSGWLKNIVEGASLILFKSPYPEWLVLEVGVEQPGDIDWITSWVKFDVAIVTRLPEVPVHVEYFSSPEEVAEEKMKLARAVPAAGQVILNGDDERIMARSRGLAAPVVTYGFGQGLTIRGEHPESLMEEGVLKGLSFKLATAGHNLPVRIRGLAAPHQLYGVMAAVAVGQFVGLNLVEIAESLAYLETPPGRFRLIPGIKETLIVDDSYNSSPAALEAAIETFSKMGASGRRLAVLGDMLELGPLTIEAHRRAGEQVAAAKIDFLITVGMRTKFLAEAAHQHKMLKKQMLHFDTWQGVGEKLQALLQPGDIVLVKGSQSIRLEKVVEEIMAEPARAAELLVRQDPEWKKR